MTKAFLLIPFLLILFYLYQVFIGWLNKPLYFDLEEQLKKVAKKKNEAFYSHHEISGWRTEYRVVTPPLTASKILQKISFQPWQEIIKILPVGRQGQIDRITIVLKVPIFHYTAIKFYLIIK